jgi:hypothetical protein
MYSLQTFLFVKRGTGPFQVKVFVQVNGLVPVRFQMNCLMRRVAFLLLTG